MLKYNPRKITRKSTFMPIRVLKNGKIDDNMVARIQG
jgi:hypothetical protein